MTHQCLNCSSQTRTGAKFCHQCGAPIATTSLPPTMPLGAAAPATENRPPSSSFEAAPRGAAATEAMHAATAYMPQTPQTYHTPHPMARQPPKKSRGGFKIVMITLAIIFALGIASVVGAVFFVKNRVNEARRRLPPIGNSSGENVTEEKLGAPIYPGARRNGAQSADFGPFSGSVAEFTTNDDLDKVAAFYRADFHDKEEFQVREDRNSDDDTGERSVVFQVGFSGGTRIITITPDKRNPKRTKIVIVGGGMLAPPPPPKGAPQGHPPDVEVPPPPGAPPPPNYAPPKR